MDQEKDKLPALPSLRYPRAALVLLSLAQLLIALDATIVFVALDSMGQHLQLPAHHLQWVISGYSVALAVACCWAGAAPTCSASAACT